MLNTSISKNNKSSAERQTLRILCVCLGNICRSPIAQAVFTRAAQEYGFSVSVDSAGTSACHVGEAPDARMQKAGLEKNYTIALQKSRALSSNDFSQFDYILAMDEENLLAIKALCSGAYIHQKAAQIELALSYLQSDSQYHGSLYVPDPYYGGEKGFADVVGMLEDAAKGFFSSLQSQEAK